MQAIAVVVITLVKLKHRAATAVGRDHVAVGGVGGVVNQVVFDQTTLIGVTDAHGIFADVADDIAADDDIGAIAIIPSRGAGIIAAAAAIAAGNDALVGDGGDGAVLNDDVVEPRRVRAASVRDDFDNDAAGALGNDVAVGGVHAPADIVNEAIADVEMIDLAKIRRAQMNAAPFGRRAGTGVDDFKVADFPIRLVGDDERVGRAVAIDERQGGVGPVVRKRDGIVSRAGTFWIHRAGPA